MSEKIRGDVVVDFLKELGFRPSKSAEEFQKQLRAKLGEARAKETFEWIVRRGQGELKDAEFYPYKNGSFDVSMALSGLYDSPFVRQICESLAANQAVFGKRILEVGCDNGVIACFIARLCLDSQVVGIDLYEESIAVARQLAQNLGIQNVEFKVCDVTKGMDESFDTVVSNRMLHEVAPVDFSSGDFRLLLKEQGAIYEKARASYADVLAGLLKDGGSLISCERIGSFGDVLGWLWALNGAGLAPVGAKREAVALLKALVTTVVAKKSDAQDSEVVYRSLCNMLMRTKGFVESGAANEFAALKVQEIGGSLIEGYNIYKNDRLTHRLSIWNLNPNSLFDLGAPAAADDPDNHVYSIFSLPQNDHTMNIRSKSAFEGDVKHMHDYVAAALKNGGVVKRISYVDGKEVIGDTVEKM